MAGSKKSDPPASVEVGDIVLAKVKGYPPWPARVSSRSILHCYRRQRSLSLLPRVLQVIDPETAPPSVKKDRPKGTKTQFYCVCFFPTGDQ